MFKAQELLSVPQSVEVDITTLNTLVSLKRNLTKKEIVNTRTLLSILKSQSIEADFSIDFINSLKILKVQANDKTIKSLASEILSKIAHKDLSLGCIDDGLFSDLLEALRNDNPIYRRESQDILRQSQLSENQIRILCQEDVLSKKPKKAEVGAAIIRRVTERFVFSHETLNNLMKSLVLVSDRACQHILVAIGNFCKQSSVVLVESRDVVFNADSLAVLEKKMLDGNSLYVEESLYALRHFMEKVPESYLSKVSANRLVKLFSEDRLSIDAQKNAAYLLARSASAGKLNAEILLTQLELDGHQRELLITEMEQGGHVVPMRITKPRGRAQAYHSVRMLSSEPVPLQVEPGQIILKKSISAMSGGPMVTAYWQGNAGVEQRVQHEVAIFNAVAQLTELSDVSDNADLISHIVDQFQIPAQHSSSMEASESKDNVDYLNTFYDPVSDEKTELFSPETKYLKEEPSHHGEKSLEDLLREIKDKNPTLNTDSLKSDYERMEGLYEGTERAEGLGLADKAVKDWQEEDIKNWARSIRQTPINDMLMMLAVVKRGNVLFSGGKEVPRISQLLTLLLMLKQYGVEVVDRGALAQVNTGEGKTTIVAMLAVIKALFGSKKVDIVTSSPVLAKRDAEKKIKFYALFNLTAGDNGGDDYNIYLKDIVYGSISAFQFDFLRDEYKKLGTRHGRPFDLVIADEVDSMLIDEGGKIAMLSEGVAGMEYLEALLAVIFLGVTQFNQGYRFNESNGTVSFVNPENPADIRELSAETDLAQFTKKYLRKQLEKTFFLEDALSGETHGYSLELMSSYPSGYPDDNKIYVEIREGQIHYCIRSLTGNKNACINSTEFKQAIPATMQELQLLLKSILSVTSSRGHTQTRLQVPRNLKEFARSQLDHWIDNAILACQLKEDKDYIVKGDDILPVDYINTGVIQSNTQWQNGLHQFVQIKHGVSMSPENFTTSFISNVGYFKKYGHNIYGLSGTLGAADSRQLLEETYDISCVIIPTYRVKQFDPLFAVVSGTQEEWLYKVCVNAIKQLKAGRAVLIICESIGNVNLIYKKLHESGVLDRKMTRYFDDSSETDISHIDSGQVFIATNLAGRGTDIETTPSVEAAGGLHVCLTFLPSNLRVEEQAFGRTSRQGKKGTGQLILSPESTYGLSSIGEIKKYRDGNESARLRHIKDHELNVIQTKDRLFLERFLPYLSPLRLGGLDKNIIKGIEERWGLFFASLERNHFKPGFDAEEIFRLYGQFEDEIRNDIQVNNVIRSHAYYTRQANEVSHKEGGVKALSLYDRAIALDSAFAYAAHYNKAYVMIKHHSSNYIDEALSSLTAAKLSIEETLMPQLQAMMGIFNPLNSSSSDKASDSSSSEETTAFSKQFSSKFFLLQLHLQHIDQAIKIINERASGNDIVIDGETRLEDLCEQDKSTREIQELYQNGICYYFTVKEKPPTDWLGIVGVFVIAAMQLIAGAALSMVGAVNVGMSLISEGVGDLIEGIKAAITGEFNWMKYLKNKAISIAISVCTMGMSAMKTVFKGVSDAVKYGVSIAKEGIKEVATKIGAKLAGAGVAELLKYGANILTSELLNLFKERILRDVKDILNQLVARLASVDMQKLQEAAQRFFNTKASELLEMGEKFIRGVIEAKKSSNGAMAFVSAVVDTADYADAIFTCVTYANRFSDHVSRKAPDFRSTARHKPGESINDVTPVINGWANQITEKILSTIQGQLINPIIVDPAISSAVQDFSEKIQRSCSSTNRTIDERLYSYRDRLMVHQQAKKVLKKSQAFPYRSAEGVTFDHAQEEPANLIHMGAVSGQLDRDILVYDHAGKVVQRIGSGGRQAPIELRYTAPTPENPDGHYEPQHGEVSEPSGRQTCFYDAVAADLNSKGVTVNSSELKAHADHRYASNRDGRAAVIRLKETLPAYKHRIGAGGHPNQSSAKSAAQQRVAGEVKNPCINCEQRGNAIVQEPNGNTRIQREPPSQGSVANSDAVRRVPIGPTRDRPVSMLSPSEDRRIDRIKSIEPEVANAVVDIGRAKVNSAIQNNPILGAESVGAASVVVPPTTRRASDYNLPSIALIDKETGAINQAKEVHRNKEKTTVGFSGAFTKGVNVKETESGFTKDKVRATRPARAEEIHTDILRSEGKAGPLRPHAQQISETQQKRPELKPVSQFNCAEVPASLQADRFHSQDRVTVAFDINTNTQRPESKLASNRASHFSQASSAEKQSSANKVQPKKTNKPG